MEKNTRARVGGAEGAPHVARPSKIISKGGDRDTFGCPYSTSNPRAGVFLHGNLGLGVQQASVLLKQQDATRRLGK